MRSTPPERWRASHSAERARGRWTGRSSRPACHPVSVFKQVPAGPPAYGARNRKRIATPFHAFPGPFLKAKRPPKQLRKPFGETWEDHSPPKLPPKGFDTKTGATRQQGVPRRSCCRHGRSGQLEPVAAFVRRFRYTRRPALRRRCTCTSTVRVVLHALVSPRPGAKAAPGLREYPAFSISASSRRTPAPSAPHGGRPARYALLLVHAHLRKALRIAQGVAPWHAALSEKKGHGQHVAAAAIERAQMSAHLCGRPLKTESGSHASEMPPAVGGRWVQRSCASIITRGCCRPKGRNHVPRRSGLRYISRFSGESQSFCAMISLGFINHDGCHAITSQLL